MVYYKVKQRFDNVTRFAWNKSHKSIKADGIFVAGELYTENEISRYHRGKSYCETVEVNPKDTYYFFGARFSEERQVNVMVEISKITETSYDNIKCFSVKTNRFSLREWCDILPKHYASILKECYDDLDPTCVNLTYSPYEIMDTIINYNGGVYMFDVVNILAEVYGIILSD